MNEQGWDTCTDPALMLEFLRASDRASDRKLRLFACASVRESHWRVPARDTARIIEIVGAQEQLADGLLPPTARASLRDEDDWVRKLGVERPVAHIMCYTWIAEPD